MDSNNNYNLNQVNKMNKKIICNNKTRISIKKMIKFKKNNEILFKHLN